MGITQDEIKELFKKSNRVHIDLGQAMNYYLTSKYDEGDANLHALMDSIQAIIDMRKS